MPIGIGLTDAEVERASIGDREVLVFRLALREGDLDLLSIESPCFTMQPLLIENERSL